MRASDGRLYVAWFSDRTASGDIYVTRVARGTEWEVPVRVTTSTDGDFNPHLIQDSQGTFHLTWFRWNAPFRGHIMYNHSSDGVTWNPASEVQVTSAADVDDWVPTLVEAPGRTLLIIFASAKRTPTSPVTDLYVSRRGPGEEKWSSPVSMAALNDPAMHDHLPFAQRIGDHVALVWERHDTSEALPWLNTKSDVYYATSTDGITWSSPIQVTKEPGRVVNLFPNLYEKYPDTWSVLWLSTRQGDPRVYEMPTARAGNYPEDVSAVTEVQAGYSHKIVRTGTGEVVLAVWVAGPEGAQDIMYRFFRQ